MIDMVRIDEKQLIKNYVKKTHALLTLNESKLLFSLAKNADKKGVIVEIGSYKGGSTVILGLGSKLSNNIKVYAIDPHIHRKEKWGKENVPLSTLDTFKKNVKEARLEDLIVPIVKTSKEASISWKKPISLLWIDGNHEYDFVKMDFILWEKHLINGGLIALHDTNNSNKTLFSMKISARRLDGPARVVKQYILNSKRFRNLKVIDSITVAQKVRHASHIDILKNKLRFYLAKLFKFYLVKYYIDQKFGLLGIFLKKYYPKSYYILKKIKG